MTNDKPNLQIDGKKRGNRFLSVILFGRFTDSSYLRNVNYNLKATVADKALANTIKNIH